ncbi:hypothetical protein, partial [Microcoleus sp. BROC3]|uniref:hypothetical protein n=1 Tax=Microcoleus sp. BROC3 TaxID=3055323 RepID=UPI002FD54DE0
MEALIVQPFQASIQAETFAACKRISLTTSLANHNCQVSKGIKSLHRSPCSGVLSFGTVQCKGLAIKYNPSYARRVGNKKSDMSGC